VHLLFLSALLWAALGASPAAAAIGWAAVAHALVIAGAAISVLARSRQALID